MSGRVGSHAPCEPVEVFQQSAPAHNCPEASNQQLECALPHNPSSPCPSSSPMQLLHPQQGAGAHAVPTERPDPAARRPALCRTP